ncbi:hypothetical protein FSP39_001816 [Pinctada imbricata]|uniref:CAP-Gly domain-containing protein n=1 Tax=Pinctada imbricata TaxID=66713 RepID=A0AA88Y8H5_PINIB|nr:hypothetical protein FSP39_001816 [Pinctada imbricata]
MEGSRHSSARQTPSANVVGDILGQTSPALIGRTEGSLPVTPPVHSTSLMSPPITSDLVRGSQEKVYGSRPQSLTSEQELTQYFENGNRHGSTHGSLPASLHGSERSESRRSASVHASPAVQNTDRPLSSSSLPVITTQQRLMAEKRSMTPDNHIRVPGDVPAARMLTPRSNVSSRASDRTITPGIQENGFNEDAQSQRILDLEDSVRNLRKLLSSREAEVHELNKELKHLKELNQSLTEELDRTKERPSSRAGLVELERKYTQVLNEKEILATEVVKLRDEVEELRRGRPGELEGDLGDTSSCGISSYNPNNPYALQRRISDLQSQIQDLQEANESAVSELSGAERRIEELTRENETLRDGQQHGNLSELKAENGQLHDQISRLYEQGYGGGMTSIREDDNRLKIEFQQVKDDNKALKERNYKLHEENLRLKEEMVNTRTGADMGNIRTGVERSSYADTRLTQSSSLYSESRLHQTEPLLDKRMSQPRRSSQDYAGDRLSATDRYQVEKSYTSPLKGSYEKEVEVRASSTLKKPADYYLTDKSADHQFRSSLDRYKSMRSTESDVKFKQSADREDVRLKHTLTRDDSGFKLRSMDNAESRIRSALEKADANLRSVDKDRYSYDSNLRDNVKDESKYRYDDKLSSYSRTLDSPRLERNYDRKVNESERSRSELYRSMPDGGASDKESQSSRERYDRSKSSERRIFGTLDMDSERLRYDKERRAPSTERDYMTADPAFEWSRNKGIKEKSKEWSRSEADLRYARGRSRTPDRYFLERKRSVSPPEHKSSRNDVYTARRHRDYPTLPNSARSSARYRWDGYDLYKRPSPSTYQDDTGDVSDTATDILVNAEPYEKQPVSPVPDNRLHRRHGSQRCTSQLSRSRRRHDSLDSSGSMSDVEDIDDQLYGKHSRSKSADGRELIRRSQPLGTDRSGLSTGSQGQTLYKTLPTPSTANLRTVTPSVLTTQHNRNMLASSTGSLTSLTTGMRPFAPRSPADISIEDVVKFSRQGGKLSQGRVKFVGHLPGRSDAYLGVELDKEDGKHDGKFEGMRYFRCKPSKGVFVAFNKVVMAWAP